MLSQAERCKGVLSAKCEVTAETHVPQSYLVEYRADLQVWGDQTYRVCV